VEVWEPMHQGQLVQAEGHIFQNHILPPCTEYSWVLARMLLGSSAYALMTPGGILDSTKGLSDGGGGPNATVVFLYTKAGSCGRIAGSSGITSCRADPNATFSSTARWLLVSRIGESGYPRGGGGGELRPVYAQHTPNNSMLSCRVHEMGECGPRLGGACGMLLCLQHHTLPLCTHTAERRYFLIVITDPHPCIFDAAADPLHSRI